MTRTGDSWVWVSGRSVGSVRPWPFRPVVADPSACRRAQPVTYGLASTSAIAPSTGPAWVRWLPYASNAYCITPPVTDGYRFEYLTNGIGSDGQLRPKKSSTEEMLSAAVCAGQGCSSLRQVHPQR